ncbi:zinc finger protein ZFPM2-like [Garra rufa]|uniref:zinc finger protein ZFPM2-like n=1 Tax=Garra rufa TaxID=137080 RepID=UPI003CCE6A64
MSRRKQSNPRQIKRPLDGGLEEEEEECISDANELTSKEEFSVEENFPADFEPDNLTCEDMEYFCGKGEENGNREIGETEMETDSEKTRHPPLEPEEWDGPILSNPQLDPITLRTDTPPHEWLSKLSSACRTQSVSSVCANWTRATSRTRAGSSEEALKTDRSGPPVRGADTVRP